MQLVGKPLAQIPLRKKDGYILLSLPKPIVSVPNELRLNPYHTLQVSTIKGTPKAESTRVPMATSTVEKVNEQIELEKQNRVVTGKEPEKTNQR